MSRLRARTWTPVERECMEWYRLWRWTKDGLDYARKSHWPMRCIACNTKVDSMSPSEIVDLAERIMRTKGVDVTTAWRNITHPPLCPPIWEPEDMDELRGIRDGQRLSRRPDAAMRASVGEARLERRFRCCYVPSDSNPNILVRREE